VERRIVALRSDTLSSLCAWTEYFKRIFLELAGTEYATLYPFAILLLASMSAAFFGAVAVTPFEALRIRSVAAVDGPTGFIGSLSKVHLRYTYIHLHVHGYAVEGQSMRAQPLDRP
jgi:hypothetical protein